MSLSLHQIIAFYAKALAADAAIAAWGNDHYGRPPQVRHGLNPKNLPKEDECPAVILHPEAADTGVNVEVHQHVFVCGLLLHDRGVTETDGVLTLDGLTRLDELGALVDAVFENASLHVVPDGREEQFSHVTQYFPVFMQYNFIKIALTNWIGGDNIL